jgi:amino acid adenylation domain-containing protein
MRYLLQHLLQDSAKLHPDATAVIDRERSLTYVELNKRSAQLANLLLELGISRGDRVGLYLDKSLESLVGIYGILKAGAVYVPLDPNAPCARLAYIAANCDIRCMVTDEGKIGSLPELLAAGAPVRDLVVPNGSPEVVGDIHAGVDVHGPAALDSQPESDPSVESIDSDLAYILYTSGSTGLPKGVMLSHLNGLAFVNWAVEEFELRPEDRLSSHAPLHFDLSIFDIFAAAGVGAAVVLVPPETSYFPVEVVRFIEANRITVWYSVPSILSMLTMRGNLGVGNLPSLRSILFAGEVFPTKYLRRLMSLLPHVRFCNLYGPTETNVCTFYEVPSLPEDETKPIPIGRAIANVEVFALTDSGALAAGDEVGELLVRGNTVMQGYWGDPDRTARGLVANPVSAELSDLTYRTGDLVRRLPDGNYDLLGRRDHQIKSRGYRIELGEIETTLYSHPDVLECAVIAVPDDLVTNRIKAFVVVQNELDEKTLVRICAERLPHYMIPEQFDFCAELPKTSTGKINRPALA